MQIKMVHTKPWKYIKQYWKNDSVSNQDKPAIFFNY